MAEKIEDVFVIKGRGLVIVSKDRNARVGEEVTLRATVRGVELSDVHPTAGLVLGGLTLESIRTRQVKAFALPTIICLCGSTRFKDAYLEATRIFTHEGRIVLSVGSFPRADDGASPEEVLGEDLKGRMDELHKRKIDLADSVFVINPGGYIGASTRGEIEYAVAHGKPVDYLEDPA